MPDTTIESRYGIEIAQSLEKVKRQKREEEKKAMREQEELRKKLEEDGKRRYGNIFDKPLQTASERYGEQFAYLDKKPPLPTQKLFTEENTATSNTITQNLLHEQAMEKYIKLQKQIANELKIFFREVEINLRTNAKELEPISENIRELALDSIMRTTKEEYGEFFN